MAILIGIEGTDGCGKKTQTQKLYDYLVGQNLNYEVFMMSFPNYPSDSSAPVKMYLRGDFGDTADSLDAYQASVLFSIDRLCTMKKVENLVSRDDVIIIFDRYVESNMIHQAGKIENLDEVENYINWLEDLEFGTLKLPRCNKVIFLDMPVDVSKKLAEARSDFKSGESKDIQESDKNHLMKAYNVSHFVAKRQGWETVNCMDNRGNVRTIEDISQEIVELVLPLLKKA